MELRIRPYRETDVDALWEVYFGAIRRVCVADYTATQVEAWAPDDLDPEIWRGKMTEIQPFVAELGEKAVGYADLQPDGYVDHFFCHPDHQRQGVGSALMSTLFASAHERSIARLHSYVSITARPFFEARGFRIEYRRSLPLRGVALVNYAMECRLPR